MNSTNQLNQLPLETELPPLRIVYKMAEVAQKKVIKKNKPVKVQQKKVTKEPLPLFNDYKFKAKDYDPL